MADDVREGAQGPGAEAARMDSASLRCSFCGKAHSEVANMVCGATTSVAICNECVERYTEIMAEEPGGPPEAA